MNNVASSNKGYDAKKCTNSSRAQHVEALCCKAEFRSNDPTGSARGSDSAKISGRTAGFRTRRIRNKFPKVPKLLIMQMTYVNIRVIEGTEVNSKEKFDFRGPFPS